MSNEELTELLKDGIGLSEEVDERDNLGWVIITGGFLIVGG